MSKFKDSEYYKSGKLLESSKKGNVKSIEKVKFLKNERILDYNTNPKLCKECDSALPYEKRNNKFCSNSCSASFSNKRRKLTEETKNKISLKLKGQELKLETKIKISKSEIKRFENEKERLKISNSLNIFWKDNDKYKKNLSSKNKGRIVSDITKKKMSISMILAHQEGRMSGTKRSIRCLYNFNAQDIRCDSKVEYSCLDYFIENYKVEEIKRCDFFIEYKYKNKIKRYLPDFIITTDINTFIVECKSLFKITDDVINSKSWSLYYGTIEPKKMALKNYCQENKFIDFFFTKDLHKKFYNTCNPKRII